MDKQTAMALMNCSPADAARELGVTSSAISQWPDEGPLPASAENRVLAWLAKKHLPLPQMLEQAAMQKAA
jgi:hypothetical protein